MQRVKGQIALFVLSLLAIGIAIYLTLEHYQHTILVCPKGGVADCATVLSSSYAVVPGTSLPITLPGLAWGVVSAAFAFAAWRLWPRTRNLRIAQFAWCLLGMFTVLYLVYAEIVLLHTICIWCTSLHIIIVIMFLITLVHLLQANEDDQDLEQDEALPPARTLPR